MKSTGCPHAASRVQVVTGLLRILLTFDVARLDSRYRRTFAIPSSRPHDHRVDYAGFVASNFEDDVAKCVAHQALKPIACGTFTFDVRAVLH